PLRLARRSRFLFLRPANQTGTRFLLVRSQPPRPLRGPGPPPAPFTWAPKSPPPVPSSGPSRQIQVLRRRGKGNHSLRRTRYPRQEESKSWKPIQFLECLPSLLDGRKRRVHPVWSF